MARRLRVACIQISASENTGKNLVRLRRLLQQSLRKKPDLIALPENFFWRGPSRDLASVADRTPFLVRDFCRLAKETGTAFLLGSLIEHSSQAGKYFNTSFLISEKGKIAARYRKIHLFQIGMVHVKTDESRHIMRGIRPATGRIFGETAGLSICYDLRFPELFRVLAARGAKLLFVPANFTYTTGLAHWEVLLKARAVENQAFVIAPAQTGVSPSSKIKSFGTSLIIDPWGRILARGSRHRQEVVTADLNLKDQTSLRKAFPVLKHRILKAVF